MSPCPWDMALGVPGGTGGARSSEAVLTGVGFAVWLPENHSCLQLLD